jgi:hypothetical protein
MKKKIHKFSMPFTHTTSVNHDNMSLSKIVQSKNFSKSCQPCKKKKKHFQKNLGLPNALPRKRMSIIAHKDPVIGSNIEHSFAGGDLPKLIFPNPSLTKGI